MNEHHHKEVKRHWESLVRKYAAKEFRLDTSQEIAIVTNDAINLAHGIEAQLSRRIHGDLPSLDNLHGFVKLPEDMATHAHNLEIAYADALARLSAIGRSIEDTVTLPKEPPEAWFRPFIMCPADEVSLAWQAFLQIAKSMRGSL